LLPGLPFIKRPGHLAGAGQSYAFERMQNEHFFIAFRVSQPIMANGMILDHKSISTIQPSRDLMVIKARESRNEIRLFSSRR
jgi:hypothetical protein